MPRILQKHDALLRLLESQRAVRRGVHVRESAPGHLGGIRLEEAELEAPTPDDLKEMSKTFPFNTAQGVDSFHPLSALVRHTPEAHT